jgi:integrase
LTDETIGIAWRKIRGEFDGPFHSLKHFAATWLAEQGVDREDIAIQLGHTDSEGRPYTSLLKTVYVHPDPCEALARIEAMVGT